MQACGHRQAGGNKDHSYITGDDFSRNIRDYALGVELLPDTFADHTTAGSRLENPQVIEALERIRKTTRKDMLQ